jgi:hypothetical protein
MTETNAISLGSEPPLDAGLHQNQRFCVLTLLTSRAIHQERVNNDLLAHVHQGHANNQAFSKSFQPSFDAFLDQFFPEVGPVHKD